MESKVDSVVATLIAPRKILVFFQRDMFLNRRYSRYSVPAAIDTSSDSRDIPLEEVQL